MKGQAATEYLMTYGWALVVIVIVVAALFVFGVFTEPPSCSAASEKLLLTEASVTAGGISLTVQNQTGEDIVITGVSASGTGGSISAVTTETGVAAGAVQNFILPGALDGEVNQAISADYTSTAGPESLEIAICSGTV